MKIVDSSCIICLFGEINCPEILLLWKDRCNHELCLPTEVLNEIIDVNSKSLTNNYVKSKKLTILKPLIQKDIQSMKARYPNLGQGELSIMLNCEYFKSIGTLCYAVLLDFCNSNLLDIWGKD